MNEDPITFRLGQTLLPCPLCGWVSDGMTESDFFRHMAATHADAIEQARAEVERLRAEVETGP